MLTSLQHPAFRWLWVSNLAGSAGRWSLVVILGAQMLQLTHSSFWVGAALFATQGPVILLAPFSGALADRFDRRVLNAGAAGVSALAASLFALSSAAGWLTAPVAIALSVLYGMSFVLQMTLRSTLVPSVVPPGLLLNAVSLSQVGTQGAEFIGPALATPVLVAAGPAPAWMLCAALYVAAALLTLRIRLRELPARVEVAAEPPDYGLSGSVRYLLARPLVLTAACAVALHCSLTMAYQGMLPMFVSNDLHADSSTYGALLTAIGLGAVTGSLALARLSSVARCRPGMFLLSLVGSGVCLTAMGAMEQRPAALAAGFLVGATQAMFMSMVLALMQSAVDDHFRGRATSLFQLITLTPMAAIGWGMGGLADVVEPRPVMLVSGVAFVIAMALYAWCSPWLRSLFKPRAWVPASKTAGAVIAAPP